MEANRAGFDLAALPPGAMDRRHRALQAELARAEGEIQHLRRRVEAFQASTSWRLTAPLRWAGGLLARPRPASLAASPPPTPAAPPSKPLSYAQWIAQEEPARLARLLRLGPGHARMAEPRVGLVLDAMPGDGWAERLAGVPPSWSVLLLHPPGPPPAMPAGVLACAAPESATPAQRVALALERLDVAFVGFPDPADRWAPDAFAIFAAALAEQPETDLAFADEDWLDASGQRVEPFFKPGWDPELQRGRDLAGPLAFHRAALARRCAAALRPGPAWRYDLACQVAAASRPGRIRHVPAVLNHRVALPPGHAAAMRALVPAHLRMAGLAGHAVALPGAGQRSRIAYALPDPAPLVSVIVPTRNRAALLRACADGVLNRTEYGALELIVADNGSEEPEALALIEALAADPRVRVLRRPGAFNWSALNNAAARAARGEVLVLLNNDVAVLRPDWLAVLASHAVQPDVGAAGAKLLYPDGRVQHAGVVTDLEGVPRHLFRYAAAGDAGPCGMMALARSVWAVTGACLAVRRELFFAVGGLNEALPVAYNDVDFCLRLAAHGHRTVWTPFAVLEHREMASRPPDHSDGRRDQAREELDRLQRDWGRLVLHDPFLNPAFSLLDEQPCLMPAPAGLPPC